MLMQFLIQLSFVIITLLKSTDQAPPDGPTSDAKPPNDIYSPRAVERRPWTNTLDGKNIKLEKRIPFHFMERTNFRELLVNCDGQCFYHSGDLKNGDCTPNKKDCGLIASIAKHGHEHCLFIGGSAGKLREQLCDGQQTFYTVTIARTINNPWCKKEPYFFQLKMLCVPREFVALAFYSDTDAKSAELNDDDTWYVCVAGEPRTTVWTEVQSRTPKRNKEYPELVFSSIDYNEKRRTLICQFVLSANKMKSSAPSEKPITVQLPMEDKHKGTPAIKIKMAQGRVIRKFNPDPPPSYILDKFKPDNVDNYNAGRYAAILYASKQQKLRNPIFKLTNNASLDTEHETVYVNNFVGPSPDTILFEQLDIEAIQVQPLSDKELDEKYEAEVRKQIDKCSDAKLRGRYYCMFPNQQRNCIYRGNCPVMAMAEEIVVKNKKLLQFHLISFDTYDPIAKKVLRPVGWAAIGFSKDRSMGNDLVVACVVNGRNGGDILVSWNEQHANSYHRTVNQDLVFNKKVDKIVRHQKSDMFYCEWQMNWKSIAKVSVHPDDSTTELKESEFNLENQEIFILYASGSHVYGANHISYHDFRQVLDVPFDIKAIRGGSEKSGENVDVIVLLLFIISFI